MYSHYIVKIKNFLVFLSNLLIDFLIKRKRFLPQPKTLLLVKLDEIGDFILFHNFISITRQSRKFGNYQITLCGNITWKELAENLHQDEIDQFIWLDKSRFYNNIRYKYHILKNIYQQGFEVVINPRYSREILFDDTIVKASNAPMRIGSEGSLEKHAGWKRHFFTDRYYSHLISQSTDIIFEFYRNKYYFEKILEEQVFLKKPFIGISDRLRKFRTPNKHVTIFLGAGDIKRKWDSQKFSKVAKYINLRYSLEIVLCGSNFERKLTDSFINQVPGDQLYNWIGQTSLMDLVEIIQDSELLVSNETSAVHIAMAVETPFICISNGRGLGRFNPYPSGIFKEAYYVYPPIIMKNLKNLEELKKLYYFDSSLNINDIEVETVTELLDKILKIK